MGLFERADPAVYLVSARHQDQCGGMIASWVTQATLSQTQPRVLAVFSVRTRTHGLIERSGRFALQLLDRSQLELVARFGLASEEGDDKWAGVAAARTRAGLPLVDGSCGFAECEVVDRLETGDRTVYLADVVQEQVYAERIAMRESDALGRQPGAVAEALAESYQRDVERDDALIRAFRRD